MNKDVKKYCSDFTKIENYEDAILSNERWDCHHRLEIMPWSGRTQSCGSKWYNNGEINKRLYEDQQIPEGLIKGRLKKEMGL